MTRYKVELDQKTCIGCRACTVACQNFIADGSKAKAIREIIEQSEFKANKEGEESCPVNAIKITKIEED